eukprot:31385-Pelagococcus_subviridis.AAC.6
MWHFCASLIAGPRDLKRRDVPSSEHQSAHDRDRLYPLRVADHAVAPAPVRGRERVVVMRLKSSRGAVQDLHVQTPRAVQRRVKDRGVRVRVPQHERDDA